MFNLKRRKYGLKFLMFLMVFVIFSCKPWSSDTETALELAGSNRSELEKVLWYYKNVNPDDLKFQAAEYLISNMIYQYSSYGPGIENLNKSYEYVYGIQRDDRNQVFMTDSLKQRRIGKIDSEYDLKRISSDYLIQQIENAFDTYYRFEWSRKYTFENFCQYILPYKIGHSDTVSWRNYAYQKFVPSLNHSVFEGTNSYYEAESMAVSDKDKIRVDGASGGYALKLSKTQSNEIGIDFFKNEAGRQLFKIQYNNGNMDAAKVRIMIDSLILGDFLFPSTGNWKSVNENASPVDFSAELDSGTHQLKLIPLDKDILVDYVSIPEYIHLPLPQSFIPEGRYYLNNSFGRVTIDKDSLVNESSIKVHPYPSRDWPLELVAKDGNMFQLLFEEDQGLKKAVDAFPFDNSDWVIIYNDHGYANQQWAFIPMDKGGFQIRNNETGRILAYRGEDSTLIQLPVEKMRDEYIWHLEKAGQEKNIPTDSMDLSIRVAQKISEITNRFHWSGSYVDLGPVSPISILDYSYGSCVEETNFQTMLLRSMGIACTVDFIFNYPERNAGHSWSVIFDLNGNTVQNNCHNPVGAGTWVDVFAKGKVYRGTNSINHNSLFLINQGKELIPEQFQNPYFKDVTSEYCNVQDVEVSINKKLSSNPKYGYILVFNNDRWVVTGWGERAKSNTVVFKDLESRGMYLPAFYINGKFEAMNDPFYFDSVGTKHHVKLVKDGFQDMVLRRKFPNLLVDESYHKLIVGGEFQGSNKSDFSDAVTIGTITDKMVDPLFHTIDVKSQEPFRYFRYVGPDDGRCNINEIVFIDSKGDIIKGEIIGTDGSFENNGKTKDKVFDGDVLTYFDAPTPSGSWVGMKLDKPYSIDKIRFATRNDGNMVEIGDEYELAYWQDQDWVSLGKMIASSDSLVYQNVPSGGLYVLKNHTKGWEERIFTIKNGKQEWW